ncbi:MULTISPECIES: hypothetical protein [unclassified Brevundimonas]|uniref:hypothetical protein n=1 Tax=unclassified Brevundimonas TaxID=2622653 RepID=UPI0025C31BE7|nr:MULTISPECIES: hypothetical protein [unclassified Brevundimonas]
MTIRATLENSRNRALLTLAGAAALLAACATAPMTTPAPAASSAFSVEQFGWSAAAGQNSIEGQIASGDNGVPFACIGSAGLTPDTPYTRARFQTLYGSTDRAQLPAAVVRARTVEDAQADYRSFVRSEACEANRFTFHNLPEGSWFVIVPVKAGDGDVTVLMRRVQTRGNRAVQLSL